MDELNGFYVDFACRMYCKKIKEIEERRKECERIRRRTIKEEQKQKTINFFA